MSTKPGEDHIYLKANGKNIMIRLIRWFGLIFFISLFIRVVGQDQFPQLLSHNVVSVKWSPQGNIYATGRVDGTVSIYNSNGLLLGISGAHDTSVYGLAFSPNGQRLATGGDDADFRVWDTSSGAMVAELLDIGGSVETLSWNSCGNFIWVSTINSDGHIIAADVSSDSYQITRSLPDLLFTASEWKPDGSQLALGLPVTDIRIVDTANYDVFRDLDVTPNNDVLEPLKEYTRNVIWHPTQNLLANGNVNGWIYIWDLELSTNNVPVLSLKANINASADAEVPFRHSVEDLIFDEVGLTIRSISADGTLRTWDTTSGAILSDTNVGTDILSAAFSPDGSQLVYNPYTVVDTPPTILVAPNADAGSDQVLNDITPFGSENVTLNGSASADPDGTISTYAWLEDGIQIATGVNPTVNLGVGIHAITLAVTDNDGMVNTDEVVVTINSSGGVSCDATVPASDVPD